MLSESHTLRFRGGGADPLVRSRPLADLLRPSTKAESGRFAACDPIWPRRRPRAPISTHELEPSLDRRFFAARAVCFISSAAR